MIGHRVYLFIHSFIFIHFCIFMRLFQIFSFQSIKYHIGQTLKIRRLNMIIHDHLQKK